MYEGCVNILLVPERLAPLRPLHSSMSIAEQAPPGHDVHHGPTQYLTYSTRAGLFMAHSCARGVRAMQGTDGPLMTQSTAVLTPGGQAVSYKHQAVEAHCTSPLKHEPVPAIFVEGECSTTIAGRGDGTDRDVDVDDSKTPWCPGNTALVHQHARHWKPPVTDQPL